jgi:hypothetical protein
MMTFEAKAAEDAALQTLRAAVHPQRLSQLVPQFFGPVNLNEEDALRAARKAIRNLGYSEKVLHMDVPPRIGGPNRWGTNWVARCFLSWREPDQGTTRATAEVDMATKTLKSLYINDHANTNIWRAPPKIPVPSGAVLPSPEGP